MNKISYFWEAQNSHRIVWTGIELSVNYVQ